jgi:1-acyl-sn-glycerol-3-phosphate acyltransferase
MTAKKPAAKEVRGMSNADWRKKSRAQVGRTWLATYGWTIDGEAPAVPKAVVCAAPHTTNWDLPFSLAICWALGLELAWIGKDSLFKKGAGPFMRGLGGIAVDRSKRLNQVQSAAQLFEERDELLLLVPPEGTRSRGERWKTGFYFIAREANVPIVLGFLDYGRKRGGFGEVFWPTGDIHADEARIRDFYADKQGKYPANTTPVYFAPNP